MNDKLEKKYKETLKKASQKINDLMAENAALKRREPVAVIGMACRFPGGADTPWKFWNILEKGIDTVSEIPATRWDVDRYYDTDAEAPGKMYVREGAFIDDIEHFDATFFEISPREAETMDPQQRLFMEVSHEALESAGIDLTQLKGSRTGVFVGIASPDYLRVHLWSGDKDTINPYSVSGASNSSAPGRVAYFYDFNGPGMAIDTACSSSLVCLHEAMKSLNDNEADYALAGGVSLMLSPELFIGFSKLGVLAADGRCKTFSHSADGYGRGEGCGVVVLKRLADAQKDNDNILAVIKGSAVIQDGKSNGFTAPNTIAQSKTIAAALERAGVSPADVGYVEAHGTATKLGDPIEVQALANIHKGREKKLLLGTVKSNIGHLEAGAGIAGVIKVVLSLQYEKIPPSLHLTKPSTYISWDKVPIETVSKITPWPKGSASRIAGVSSFGFSGINAHVIIAEAPEPPSTAQVNREAPDYSLLTLSAHKQDALIELMERYREYLSKSEASIAAICKTTNTSRSTYKHRLALVGTTKENFVKKLSRSLENPQGIGKTVTGGDKPLNGRIVFMYTGQDSQYVGMGRQLYQTEPVFKGELDKCDALFLPLTGNSIVQQLYGEDAEEDLISQALHAQPVIFAVEYALTKLWQSWGIEPSAVMGHSIGEYAAACIAGVFSLEEAVKLVAFRGKLLQTVPAIGKMSGVLMGEEKVKALLTPYSQSVSIAAVNAKENVTISGETAAVDAVLKEIKAAGVFVEKLNISHPFHSVLMEPYAREMYKKTTNIVFSKPQLPFISGKTGEWAQENEICSADYWGTHIRDTVRFYDSLKTLEKDGYDIFIEMGGSAVLTGLASQCVENENALFIPSLRKGRNPRQMLLMGLADLYRHEIPVNWEALNKDLPLKKVVLPTYTFQKKRYPVAALKQLKEEIKEELPEIPTRKKLPETPTHHSTEEKENVQKGVKRMNKIVGELKEIISTVARLEITDIGSSANLFSLGLDSLMLVQIQRKIANTYGIDISLNQFFLELTTVEKIAGFTLKESRVIEPEPQPEEKPVVVHKTGPPVAVTESGPPPPPRPSPIPGPGSTSGSMVEGVLAQQIEGMKQLQAQQAHVMEQQTKAMNDMVTQQLEYLNSPGSRGVQPPKVEKKAALPASPIAKKSINFRHMKFEEEDFTETQREFLKRFISRYNKRTQKSKDYAAKYRPVLSDWINTLNFHMSLKELKYPIVSDRSQGSRFWDLDGNEYVDLAIGFGINFFGHRAPFIMKALEKQMVNGFELGTQASLSGEVADLICKATGVERVAFCNIGSDAVMVAVRLARTVTVREKIVIFNGSYHGTTDGVLAFGDDNGTIPLSPGVCQGAVDNVVVLDYGSEESLEKIREMGDQLAAVLVEPVQGLNPELQPKEFLKKLRQITRETGTALIFDEMVTGFRIGLGGAQEHFGVKADIVTYGKIIAGGMTIGLVAGRSHYLDAVDGGDWNYGDGSYPEKEVTYFAGSFCKHPFTVAAAKAVLLYLEERGPGLYKELNRRTQDFVDTMNDYFEKENVPVHIVNFGSLFRFKPFIREGNSPADLKMLPMELDVLFFLLMERGVYTWEKRTCFFSTVHTDEDVNYVIDAIKESIKELRAGGFSLGASSTSPQPPFSPDTPPSPGSPSPGSPSSSSPSHSSPSHSSPSHSSPSSASPSSKSFSTKPSSLTRASGEGTSTLQRATFPMSSIQKRLFALSQTREGEKAYHLTMAIEITGELDHKKLESIFQHLMERHDSLRTGLSLEGEEYLQRVCEAGELELPLTYGRSTRETLGESIEAFIAPYDLAVPPLFRVGILDLGYNTRMLLLDAHHVAADGISMNILAGEIMTLYAGGSLPGKGMEYREYVAWEKNYRRSDLYRTHERAWLKQLAGELPVLDLPTDFARPERQAFSGKTLRGRLGREQTAGLKKRAGESAATLYMVLLAAYYILLSRLSRGEDILVGVPIAIRDYGDFDSCIGMFANTIVQRGRPQGNKTFGQFLDEVKLDSLEAYANHSYPFEMLVERLGVKRDIARNLIFDAMFVFENANERVFKMENLVFREYFFEADFSLFDITLEIAEEEGILQLSFNYCDRLFKEETVKTWFTYYQRILGQICGSANPLLEEIELLSAEDRHRLLEEFNNTEADYPGEKTLHQLFEEQVARTPDTIAVSGRAATVGDENGYGNGTGQMSYRDLSERANHVAWQLRGKGVGTQPDVIVGIMVERSIEMITGIMGILKAGGAYLPIDPDYPEARKQFMLKDSGTAILISDSVLIGENTEILENIDIVDLKINCGGASGVCVRPSAPQPLPAAGQPAAKGLAYVIYTSGSTGKPKGVMVEHAGLANISTAWLTGYKLREFNVRLLQLASISFDVFCGDICRTLLSGGQMIIASKNLLLSPENLFNLMRLHEITIWESTPALIFPLFNYIKENSLDITFMKILILGSDICPMKNFKKLVSDFGDKIRIINSYGTTEATIDSSYYEPSFENLSHVEIAPTVPIGKPMGNTQFYVLTPTQKLLPAGLPGELCISGNGLARGYLNKPHLTTRSFISHPFKKGERLYRTGDSCRWLSNGNIEFFGRLDHQVKIRGYRIELGEIENILLTGKNIKEAVVLAVKDKDGENYLAAYYVEEEHRQEPM
ncbi:MAG: amino acid adenylation domain-containing protein, partial [bacterium]|nr:amino acid adenylation domain-containing protein [bacterium]